MKTTPTDAYRLGQLNYFRKLMGMKPYQPQKGAPPVSVEDIKSLALEVLKANPKDKRALEAATTKLSAAVAEGAYSDNRVAQNKTGHTTNGKTATQSKKEARMAKQVAKNVKASDAKLQKAANDAGITKLGKTTTAKGKQGGARTRALDADEISLAQVAEHIKMSPKAARALARKNKSAIAKLEIKGKKYVFAKASRDKVAAILKA